MTQTKYTFGDFLPFNENLPSSSSTIIDDVVKTEEAHDYSASYDDSDFPVLRKSKLVIPNSLLVDFVDSKSETMNSMESTQTSSLEEDDNVSDKTAGDESDSKKKLMYFIVKVPRFYDENLTKQIESAQFEVDEKIRNRDSIRSQIITRKADIEAYAAKVEAAVSQEKAARDLLRSKYQEEKNFIRQIKQQQLEEFEQTIDHTEIEDNLKLLRMEIKASFRENVSKAVAVTQAAQKKHSNEILKLKELQAQFKAADRTQQEAYAHLQSLKKQSYEKNKHFYNYKDDLREANNLVLKGNKEALQRFCDSQVDRVMRMWNNDERFRKDYVRCNAMSTVRRLKTLDGRSLGPGEKSHVVRAPNQERPQQVVPSNKVESKIQRAAKPEEPKLTKKEEKLARKAEEAAKLKEQFLLEEKTKAMEALERKKQLAELEKAQALQLQAQKEAKIRKNRRERKARKKENLRMAAAANTDDVAVAPEEEQEDTTALSTESATPDSETPTNCEVRENEPVTVTKRPRRMQTWIWVLFRVALFLLAMASLLNLGSHSF